MEVDGVLHHMQKKKKKKNVQIKIGIEIDILLSPLDSIAHVFSLLFEHSCENHLVMMDLLFHTTSNHIVCSILLLYEQYK